MEVNIISSEAKAACFLPGEIGEVDVRVVKTPRGLMVAVVAYQLGVLVESDKAILRGVCQYLKDKLEAARYDIATRPDGQE